jgi:tagatose 1,6-diphosphate aldolase
MLLDAEFSAAQAIADGALPGTTALAVPLEAQGYGDVASVPRTTFLPDWSPAQARRLGAAGCKLLLPYRVDVPEQADSQDERVREAVAGCREQGLALILEPIVYALAGEERAGGERFGELVVEGARRLATLEPDVLKVQHPGSYEDCVRLDEACGPSVPWVLLGGGADEERLAVQIDEACRAGASGFVVGRTLFDAALVPDPEASERALEQIGRPMLERLGAIARRSAQPWRERVGAIAPPPLGWYR